MFVFGLQDLHAQFGDDFGGSMQVSVMSLECLGCVAHERQTGNSKGSWYTSSVGEVGNRHMYGFWPNAHAKIIGVDSNRVHAGAWL